MKAEKAKQNANREKDYEIKIRKELKPIVKKEIMSNLHLDGDND